MRILFVARAIDDMAGGVEKMITTIMNAMVCKNHEVSLMTWDVSGAKSFYPISSTIRWFKLDMGNPMKKATLILKWKRAIEIRELIRGYSPDLIVCFQDGPYAAIRTYSVGMGIPVIAAERNAPSRFDYTSAVKRKWLIYFMFSFSRRIMVQCDSYVNQYPVFLKNRIVTIPNPVAKAEGFSSPAIPNTENKFILLSVGRLSYQKNFQVLINAFALVANKHPEWQLNIIGEGEERGRLENLITHLSLEDKVFLLGKKSNISEFYTNAHLFCLPSLWEGFPNALAEALAHGLPSIGFQSCAGVCDLIISGSNGVLVEDMTIQRLAGHLDDLMANPEKRKILGVKALQISDEFAEEKIFSMWEDELLNALKS